jgi:hypothetical protein
MAPVCGALTILLVSLAASADGPASTDAPATKNAPASKSAPAECPDPAQLATALNALVVGLAPVAATPLPLASGARLAVVTSPEGDVRVDLVDGQGEVVLHRVLPAPPRGHAPDCAALAETIALIVDRYLHDVGYEAPPLPPPAPPPPPVVTPPTTLAVSAPVPVPAPRPRALWRVGLYGGARRGDAGGFDGDGDLALGVEPARDGRRWGVRLSAGYAPAASARWMTDKTATLRRVPLRVGAYLSRPFGPGRLEPGLGAGFELFLVSASGPGTAGGAGAHAAPSADVSLGYAVALAGPLYARLLSRAASTVPYTFKALDGSLVWGTSRFYGEVGVEFGFAFQ